MTTALAIRNELGIMEVGRILAKSGFFADAKQEAQAVVKVMAGAELGFGPIASMSGIYIIKGKPAVSANLMAAAVKRSAKYDYRIIAHTSEECTLAFFENGEKCGESSFTADDAKRAGTQNMAKFPRNMLFARAMSNGAKWFCPDIFGGPVYTPDELGQPIDAETGEILDIAPSYPAQSAAPKLDTPPIDAATVGWALALTTEKGTPFADLTAEQLSTIVDKQMGTLDERNAAAILLAPEAADIRTALEEAAALEQANLELSNANPTD